MASSPSSPRGCPKIRTQRTGPARADRDGPVPAVGDQASATAGSRCSDQTWRTICANASAGCAPDTPYLPSIDEERHAVDAVGRGLRLVGTDGVEVAAALQGLARGVGVESGIRGELDELVLAPEVAALGEVRGHEPLGELVLAALLLGEVQQLVGLDGVGVLEEVEAVLEAGVGGDAGDALRASARTCSRGMPLCFARKSSSSPSKSTGVSGESSNEWKVTSTAGASSSADAAASPFSRLRLPM